MKSNEEKTIYWNFPQREVDMKWKDNNLIIIDGKELNILTETYDKRNSK